MLLSHSPVSPNRDGADAATLVSAPPPRGDRGLVTATDFVVARAGDNLSGGGESSLPSLSSSLSSLARVFDSRSSSEGNVGGGDFNRGGSTVVDDDDAVVVVVVDDDVAAGASLVDVVAVDDDDDDVSLDVAGVACCCKKRGGGGERPST